MAANACPSMVPPTFTARRVPSAAAESGTVTNVGKAPPFSIGAVKTRSRGWGKLLTRRGPAHPAELDRAPAGARR